MLRKFLNISVLVSLLSSFYTFAPILPAHAAPAVPLESMSATLAQPIFSEDWNTDPSFSNVTYTWTQNHTFEASASDPCIAALECHEIRLILIEDAAPTTTYQGQEWMDTIDIGDIILDGPLNAYVESFLLGDYDENGRVEELDIQVGCSDECTFTTSTQYSVTIVNYPIKNPQAPDPYVPGVYSTTTHYFHISDGTDFPVQFTEYMYSVVAIGHGVTVTASVEPSLAFSVTGLATSTAFYTDSSSVSTVDNPDTCDFGTLVPGAAKVCLFNLNIETNAANGYSIYVVQDQDMNFNGNSISQFRHGARTDDSDPRFWASPSGVNGHLGYSTSDASVISPSGDTPTARWAGIPTIAELSEEPFVNETGLVADSATPGIDQYTYGLKIESASTLPQGTNYTHNEYFLVVGNF